MSACHSHSFSTGKPGKGTGTSHLRQISIKIPLRRVDVVSQERLTMWHRNVRAYLNRSHIEILSSVDTGSSSEPRKKISYVMQLL